MELTEQAKRIHRTAIVIDGHNDLPMKVRDKGDSSFDKLDISKPQPDLHTDIPRLRAGGVGAQFWAAWVPPDAFRQGGATRFALEQIDLIHRMVSRYPGTFELARSADDVIRIHESGKIASLIGLENGIAIENSLGALRMFYDLGVRYMTLTHIDNIDWADSATDKPHHGGLTAFGEDVIKEMNRLGMLVDISHVSDDTMKDVLRVTSAPIIASHSSARAVADHPRNVPDDVLRSIAAGGGMVMVVFSSAFSHPESAKMMQDVFDTMRQIRKKCSTDEEFDAAQEKWIKENPIPRGNVAMMVDHIDHIANLIGIDHVGLGSDFDGVSVVPEGLDDVSCYPNLTQEMLNRDYSEPDIIKVLGGNLLRVLRLVE